MTAKFLNRSSPPHILTLVLATATGSLTLNVFLPSLPGMARHFNTDYAVVQLAVSLYLVATAGLQLIVGPASDRFGRRPVMLGSFGVFLVGTVGAIFAPTIEILLACRLLQAFSAAGMVLARAIVRDTVDAADAAGKIGYITMGMAVVPMIGPAIGGFLDESFGWHSTFVLTLGFGLLAIAIVYADLGETNHARSANFRAQFAAYPELLVSRRFWGYTLTAVFTSGAFFAFIGGVPYVSSEILELNPSEYGLYFAIISLGYIFGNFLSGRFARRVGINRMMLAGNILSSAGMILAILLFWFGYEHPLSLFGPAILTGIGNGTTLPSANAGMVSVSPHLAGSASGLGGALQMGGGAVLSVVAAALLNPDTGAYPLLLVMLLSSCAAILATLYVMKVARSLS